MKRVALVLLLVVAVVATIVFALRGHEVAPGDSSSRATEVVATGTVGRGPPRSRSAKSEPEPPPATRRIAGVVVDAMSRDPIAGAAVLVARRRTPVPGEGFVDTELPGEPEFRATTSAEGSFGVDVPADGPWFVTARAPDCADAIVLASVGDDLRLRLARGVEKTFTVRRMVDRAPIAGAEIWVYGRDGSVGPPQLRCVTDEHGEARIRVAADDECLVVRAKGYARADRITSATDLLLVPGSWITGVVRDRAGHAVAGAVLRIDERAWLSDRDGRFVLDEIPTGRDGRQLVEVKADAFAPWSGRLHCGDADAVVELSRIGAVVGTVVLPDGSPAVDAEVTNWTAYSIRSSIDVERRRTDAAGAFRVAAWAGPQSVSAKWRPDGGHAADETFGAAEVEVPDGGTVEGVVIRLTPKSFVPLRIVDAAGRAVTDVLVRAKVPDDFEVRGDLVLVSVEQPAGAAVDLSLCDGSTRGSRWQGVHVAATTQASADGPAVEVRLPVLRELTVTILAADGSGLPASALSSLGLHSESGEEMQATSEGEDVSKTWMVDPARRYVIFVEAERLASIGRVLTP